MNQVGEVQDYILKIILDDSMALCQSKTSWDSIKSIFFLADTATADNNALNELQNLKLAGPTSGQLTKYDGDFDRLMCRLNTTGMPYTEEMMYNWYRHGGGVAEQMCSVSSGNCRDEERIAGDDR